ncbi:MAG: hypothetical protein ABEH78_00120 [Haloferacaceae archaeon]
MPETTARSALREALADWRRHAGALAVVAAAFGVAAVVARPEAQYAAYLVTFVVWMVWFVLTTIEWIRRAEF